VAKVDPTTCETDLQDDTVNTKTEVWVELMYWDHEDTYMCEEEGLCGIKTHALECDTGGDTYEEAVINLANNVFKEFGGYVE